MAYRGEGVNEHGTPVSLHTCDSCGHEFSVCPAVPEDARDQWDGCMQEDCESYEPTRDADLYFGLGMIEREDAT